MRGESLGQPEQSVLCGGRQVLRFLKNHFGGAHGGTLRGGNSGGKIRLTLGVRARAREKTFPEKGLRAFMDATTAQNNQVRSFLRASKRSK